MKRYGFKLADRELACVPNDSPEGEDYCKAMSCALNFAWCNRQMITHWTRKAFERIFGMNEHTLNMQLVYDVSHNIAKVERHRIDGEGMRDLVIHRKGATRSFLEEQQLPAKYNGIGQPVIIPGSMGTASWVFLGNKKSSDLRLWIHSSWRRKDYVEIGCKTSSFCGRGEKFIGDEGNLYKILN